MNKSTSYRVDKQRSLRSSIQASGFSLIEFLVASILSMIVLIAVGSGYFASRQINDVALARLSVQQDLRNASNMIVRDARMAGGFGCFNMANSNAKISSDGADSDDTLIKLTTASEPDSGIPIKSGALGVTGFGNALVFQYGLGTASVSGDSLSSLTVHIPDNDPLQNVTTTTPLTFSSCMTLDRPASFVLTRNSSDIQITNIQLPLDSTHSVPELSLQRYISNAYAVGNANGQQGLFRFQLQDGGTWGNPELLMADINSWQIEYGYLRCSNSTAASDSVTSDEERFIFSTNLPIDDANGKPMVPTLIRITLNGNSVAATGRLQGGQAEAGNVHVYTIEAAVRGGTICADRN